VRTVPSETEFDPLDVQLRDGRRVTLRAVRAQDKDKLQEAGRALSVQSSYYPFLLPLRCRGGQRALIAEAKPRVVALHLRGVFDLEYTALKMLTEAEKRYRENGVFLWLVGLNPGVLAMVQRSPLGQTLGRERMFFNLEQAVATYQASYGR
jgi:hypothetical protein